MTEVSTQPRPIQRDWFSKTVAGVLLGLGLALGASAVLDHVLQPLTLATRGQLVMWLVPLVWFCVMGFCYLFRSGLSAWLWLGTANFAVFGLWGALRFF